MSHLVKLFLLFCGIMMYTFTLLLYKPHSYSLRTEKIKALASITKLPSLSYSSSFLQQRVPLYRDKNSILFSNMLIESKRDFVYAY